MTDRRLFPSNGRVAHISLQGKIDNVTFVKGETRGVCISVSDIRREPGGARERQMLFGDAFLVLEPEAGDGFTFGQAQDGGYVGYVRQIELSGYSLPTHWVVTAGAHVFAEPNIKSEPLIYLPYGAVLYGETECGAFLRLVSGGYVSGQQIAVIDLTESEPESVAESMIGVPYLWGGDSGLGLDCSGLVHIAMRAAGVACPRDSDLQALSLGRKLSDDENLQRGDLVFWQGHVGIMLDAGRICHANAHRMAVTIDALNEVSDRIARSGGGSVTCRRRL